jgi:hypothetical protein
MRIKTFTKQHPTVLQVVGSVAVFVALCGLFVAVLHPWLMNWRTTGDEQAIVLPGDTEAPSAYLTRAITIDAWVARNRTHAEMARRARPHPPMRVRRRGSARGHAAAAIQCRSCCGQRFGSVCRGPVQNFAPDQRGSLTRRQVL